LYSICNQKDEPRLARFVAIVEQSKAAGELQPDEILWIEGIVQQAQTGDWSTAARNARRLMMDQVKP